MDQFELLIKKLHQPLTEEEQQRLEAWLQEKKEHRDFFEMLKTLKGKGRDLKNLSDIDLDKKWESIRMRSIQKSRDKKRKFISTRLIPYGIAATLLILVGIKFSSNSKEEIHTPLPTEVRHEITSGTDKASLILEDGTVVDLEKGANYSSATAHSDGEQLIYTSDSNEQKQQTVYNYLSIPRGGQFHLVMADQTEVWLNSETKIKYPVNFIPGEPRKVELLYGEAYFEVSPSSQHNGDTFLVESNWQEVEVLGTAFNIKAYDDEDYIYTTLQEGSIALSTDQSSLKLKPMDQTILHKNSLQIESRVVDAYDVSSWINGVFSFKNLSLKNIMTVLSRWYDTEVIFESSATEDLKFNGVLRKNQNIEEILSTINNLKTIAYEFEHKKVIIK